MPSESIEQSIDTEHITMSNYVFLLHKLVNQCRETETQANKMSLNKHLNLHKFKNKTF